MLKSSTQYFRACLLIFTIISLPAAADTQFAASHFPIDEDASDYILITDAAGVAPTVTVDFYDRAGTRQNSTRKILRLHGSIEINVRDYLDETGSIVLSSDSDGVVSRYWHISQNGKTSSNSVGEPSWGRSVFSYPLQPLTKHRQFCTPYDITEASSSYIIVSDVSSEHEISGAIIELCLYSQSGELITALRREIRKRETVDFKLNEYLDENKIDVIASESRVEILTSNENNSKSVGEKDTNQAQARSVIFPPLPSSDSADVNEGRTSHIEYRKTGKAVLKVIEGNVICEYAQFHPEVGILSIVPADCILADAVEKQAVNLLYLNFWWDRAAPLLRADAEEELIITDAYGYGPVVQIDFLSHSGSLLAQAKKLLPQHGTVLLNLLDYVKPTGTGEDASLSREPAGTGETRSHGRPRIEREGVCLSNGMMKIQSHIPIIANYKNPPHLLPATDEMAENLAVGWHSPSDNLQIHLFATNTGSEIVKAQARFYREDGTVGESKELHLKPKIVSAWKIEEHFKRGQLGSIALHSHSKALNVLCVGIDANTKQVLMAIQAQEIKKSDNF